MRADDRGSRCPATELHGLRRLEALAGMLVVTFAVSWLLRDLFRISAAQEASRRSMVATQ